MPLAETLNHNNYCSLVHTSVQNFSFLGCDSRYSYSSIVAHSFASLQHGVNYRTKKDFMYVAQNL